MSKQLFSQILHAEDGFIDRTKKSDSCSDQIFIYNSYCSLKTNLYRIENRKKNVEKYNLFFLS